MSRPWRGRWRGSPHLVVENTKWTLLKLVSKDRAIIDLLRLEQCNRGFMDFLEDAEDQIHLRHNP